ncbi:MAG: cob(I)yrinic acid a,c-diamide adenosyltransferase [bacterium]|nr:cob(I)yrinic acid a,c-diamide adenosyltransferase [bacterium]
MYLIFTGNGKGKTTSALGYAMRAVGGGKKVLMVQFIKGPWKSGEDESVKIFGEKFKIVKMGKGFVGILGDKLPWLEHQKAALEGVAYAHKQLISKKWDVLILDEIHVAIALKLLSQSHLNKLVSEAKKLNMDIIATGRDAAAEQIEQADLVTEMREIKHPYATGSEAVKGIEY